MLTGMKDQVQDDAVQNNTSQGFIIPTKWLKKGANRKPTHLMQVKLRRNVRIKDQSKTPSKREMERKAIDRSQLICNPKIEQLRNETERSD